MKKGIAAALLLISAAGLWSQDITALYNERKITILSSNENPASKDWVVSEGYNPINEPTFLRLAGYEAEAKASARNLAKQWTLWGSFAGLMTGGLLVALVPMWVDMAEPPYSSALSPTFYIGLGMICLSPLPIVFTGPERITPLGKAARIADEYNGQLLEKLQADPDAYAGSY